MIKAELIPGSLKQNVRLMIRPIADVFSKWGISPNMMTLLGVVLSGVAAAYFATFHIRYGGLFYMLAGFCDIFDGAMARRQGRGSSFGAFLDSTLDRFAEAIALLGVMVYFHRSGVTPMVYVTYLAVISSMLVSYTKSRAEGLGQDCNVGLLERPERVTCVVVGALLFGDYGLKVSMVLMMILAFFTVGQRMHHTWRGFMIKEKEANKDILSN